MDGAWVDNSGDPTVAAWGVSLVLAKAGKSALLSGAAMDPAMGAATADEKAVLTVGAMALKLVGAPVPGTEEKKAMPMALPKAQATGQLKWSGNASCKSGQTSVIVQVAAATVAMSFAKLAQKWRMCP